MNKKQFIDQYVCTFLASYMASRYDEDCMNGHPNEPYDHQPVEDARFLAQKAWEQTYNPYEIGRQMFEDGKGVSDLALAVETHEDLLDAQIGYEDAQRRKSYYDYT